MKKALHAVIVASFTSTALAAGQLDISAIAKRRQLMKDLASHAKAISRLIDRPNRTTAEIERRAFAMSALAKQMPALFKPGTGLDTVTTPRTGAKPVIWHQWKKFQAAAHRLATESDMLGRMAPNAGRTSLRLQFAATTMGGCGNCHKAFRKKLD